MYSGHSPPPVSNTAIQRVRKIARPVLAVVFGLMTLIAVAGFFLPSSMTVRGEITVNAGEETLRSKVADLKQWPKWGPWFQKDPFCQTAFPEAARGAGALMQWTSSEYGEGKLKVLSERPGAVAIAVEFSGRGRAEGRWTFTPAAEGQTKVAVELQADFGQNTGRRWWGLIYRSSIQNDVQEMLQSLKSAAENGASFPD